MIQRVAQWAALATLGVVIAASAWWLASVPWLAHWVSGGSCAQGSLTLLGTLALSGAMAYGILQRVTSAWARLMQQRPGPESALRLSERSLLEQSVRQRTAELQAATEIARSALDDARRADRLKDTFLAMASHELRSPLQSTLYWAEMLKRNNDPAHAAIAADHIIHNVNVQSRLIDDLLDISRILTGQLRLEWCETDPLEVVQRAADGVRAQATGRGITIEVHTPAQPLTMTTDPVRLEQVAWNLMSNAVHASPDGETVQVWVQADADRLRLVVQDAGVGIEPSQIPQIFETFRQGASAARHGGLGLGLPITRSIVRQFDGDIQAASEGPGRGARFTVELPLRGAAPPGPPPQSLSALADLTRLQGLRVLYVEDKTEAAHNGRLLLQSLGLQVEHCASFEQAARRVAQADFDLLLAALRLDHGHTGEDLVRLLQSRQGRRPVAVALSASGSKRDVRPRSDSGFFTHVVMPVTSQEMGHALLQALREGDGLSPCAEGGAPAA